jgi:hypothetical protein
MHTAPLTGYGRKLSLSSSPKAFPKVETSNYRSMISENILWARTISPTGRVVKEETFAGDVLAFIGIAILIVLVVAFVLYVS